MQLFITLPWRGELLRALLAYDLVGFQTARDCRNFLDCVERLMPEADVAINGSAAINTPAGRTSAGIFPIGIAADAWRKRATSAAVDTIAGKLRSELEGRRVILGVDRLDYSKGLLQRLHAFERMLEQDPTLHERVVLIQLQIPSRESVGEYQLLKREIEGAVGRITGRFATPTWAPIRYMYTSVDPNTLAALYRIADVGLVTSLIDGMNLVSKEFCACQVDDPGVLVLSETAGAACQLADGAILVNPHDIERTAEALRTALNMSRSERGERMSVLWNTVRASNVFAWADDYVNALLSADRHAPLDSDEYLPILAPPSQLGFRG